MEIKIKVNLAKFEELFSIEDFFHFGLMPRNEIYEVMLKFVVDDEGNEVPVEDARKLFKKVSLKQWPEYIVQFRKAVEDAFISPTNGGS
jgi:hypothetical protein